MSAGATETKETTPTRLVLVRHGESNVTVRRVIGGYRTCDGLSPLGVQQSARLAERLAATKEITADVVIASNFERARETADALLPALGGATLEIDPAFGEHDPGPDIDGLSFESYVERFGTPDWQGDPHVVVFPGGETTAQFHLRVGAALSRLVVAHAGSTIVIVCHGGVVDAVFRQLLRAPSTGGFELQTANTSLTEFVATGAGGTTAPWRIVRYNDAAHLAGLPAATPRA
jgi:probable phosphoglycerate mutase